MVNKVGRLEKWSGKRIERKLQNIEGEFNKEIIRKFREKTKNIARVEGGREVLE